MRGRGKKNNLRTGTLRVSDPADRVSTSFEINLDHIPEVPSKIRLSDLSAEGKYRLVEAMVLNNDPALGNLIKQIENDSLGFQAERLVRGISSALKSGNLEALRTGMHFNRLMRYPDNAGDYIIPISLSSNFGLVINDDNNSAEEQMQALVSRKDHSFIMQALKEHRLAMEVEEMDSTTGRAFIEKWNRYMLGRDDRTGIYEAPEIDRFLYQLKQARQDEEADPAADTSYIVNANAKTMADVCEKLTQEGFDIKIYPTLRRDNRNSQEINTFFQLDLHCEWINEQGGIERIHMFENLRSQSKPMTVKNQIKEINKLTDNLLAPYLSEDNLAPRTNQRPKLQRTNGKIFIEAQTSAPIEASELKGKKPIPSYFTRKCSHQKTQPKLLDNGFITYGCLDCSDPLVKLVPVQKLTRPELEAAYLEQMGAEALEPQDSKTLDVYQLSWQRVKAFIDGKELPKWDVKDKPQIEEEFIADDVIGEMRSIKRPIRTNPLQNRK